MKKFTLLIAVCFIFALAALAFAGPPEVGMKDLAKVDKKITISAAHKILVDASGQMIVHKKALEGGIGGSIVAQREDGTRTCLATTTLGTYAKTEQAMTAETVPIYAKTQGTSSAATYALTTTVMTTTTGTSAALGGRFTGAAQIGTMTTARAAQVATHFMAEAGKDEMTRKTVFA